MSRPLVLVCLLVILIITSQFEWKQQLAGEIEASPTLSPKPLRLSYREEAVKEKIILCQEKNIQRLNDLVRSLQQQLLQCQCSNNTVNRTGNSLTDSSNEFERQQILDD